MTFGCLGDVLQSPSSYLLGLSITMLLLSFFITHHILTIICVASAADLSWLPSSSCRCYAHFCSYPRRLLLSLFLAAPSFSLACQIISSNSQTLVLLLSAALFLLYIQFVISCCIWLISFSLQLNHGFVLFSSEPHTSSATLVSIFAIRPQLATLSFFLSFPMCIPW